LKNALMASVAWSGLLCRSGGLRATGPGVVVVTGAYFAMFQALHFRRSAEF